MLHNNTTRSSLARSGYGTIHKNNSKTVLLASPIRFFTMPAIATYQYSSIKVPQSLAWY